MAVKSSSRKPKPVQLKGPPAEWFNRPVERRKLADLRPYPNNPRTHSREQIDQIVASMKEVGFTQPLLIDEDNMILAGHGRARAVEQCGLKDITVIVMRGLSAAQKRALVVSDNQIALNAEWDQELLQEHIGELSKLDYDLSILGFGELTLEAPTVAEPSAPKSPKKTGTIFVTVSTARMEKARKVMAAALTAAKIDHNL